MRHLDELRHRLRCSRGQGGFALLAGLLAWLLAGSMMMVALLGMTMSATRQVAVQHDRAQQARAIDGALETAVAQIQIDPSGRIGQPTGKDDGSCAAGLDNPKNDLVVDDGLGNRVTVSATCSGSAKKGEAHRVDLVARLDGAPTSYGAAVLEVVKAKGPGNNVTVQSWTIGGDGSTSGSTGTTPTSGGASTTTTAPAATTTTPATTTTVVTSSDVTASVKITSEWATGYCANVDVTNNGKSTTKWTVGVPVRGTLYQFWNGDYTRAGDVLTVSGVDWNRSLKSGESTAFGFCSNL